MYVGTWLRSYVNTEAVKQASNDVCDWVSLYKMM